MPKNTVTSTITVTTFIIIIIIIIRVTIVITITIIIVMDSCDHRKANVLTIHVVVLCNDFVSRLNLFLLISSK